MQLPGEYGAPDGRVLLALTDTMVAGVVCLRRLDDTTAEVKRLFVRPQARGHGVGRKLMEALIAEARTAGYSAIQLETLEAMREALALYRSLGFADTARYRPPTSDDDQTVSLQMSLSRL